MTNLFDKTDVFTIVTAEQVKVGDKGYFGNSWLDLQNAIKNNYLASISTIFTGRCDCFMNNAESTIYGLFLPEDKVKNKVKEPVYRPIKTIDELFNFLIPDFEAVSYDTYEKAVLTLLRIYELKSKQTGNICYRRFSQLYLSDNYIRLDEYNLEHLFNNFEIKKDDEFVPFGIKEE